MISAFRFTSVVITVCASASFAQNLAAQTIHVPPTAVGTWEGKSTTGPKDSVITTFSLTATATTAGWTMKLATRPSMAARVLSAGGDSVVTESGPYDSVLRPGQKVTTRSVMHFKGDLASGSFEAKFTNGDVTTGKMSAVRKK